VDPDKKVLRAVKVAHRQRDVFLVVDVRMKDVNTEIAAKVGRLLPRTA